MITAYVTYLKNVKRYSIATAIAYEKDLRQFARFAKETDSNMRWSTVTRGFIESYVQSLYDRTNQPATICRRIASLRGFYNWAISRGMTTENPARYIVRPKLAKRLPNTINEDAIQHALYGSGAAIETKAIIAIAYETGMRLQEILDMRYSDIDLESMTIRVHGKGNKERLVYLGTASAMLVERLNEKNGQHLFGQLEQREARTMVYNALKPWSDARQLSPHALRHSFATTMLNNGASLKAISDLLGHESVKTTEIYAQMSTPTKEMEYRTYAPHLN